MKLSKKWIGVIAGAITVGAFALVLNVAIPHIVSANGGPGGFGGRSGFVGRGGPEAPTNTYLADALGITAAQLQTAKQKAAEAGLAQAVEKGLITQAQADAIKQRGSLGRFGLGMGGHLEAFGDTGIDPQALLADALGISVDKLQAAQATARDAEMAQAVKDGRITQAQADNMKAQEALQKYFQDKDLQGQVRSLYEQAVKDAVTAGVITQAQADQVLSNLKSGPGMHSGFMMPGFGGPEMGGHGMGGRHGGGRGFGGPNGGHQGGSNSTPTTPSSQTPMRFTF